MKTIPLNKGLVALVDDEDFESLSQFHWYARNDAYTTYVVRKTPLLNGKQELLRMHRVLLKARKNELVDHRDGNGLNNQKANLRIATKAQNNQNSKVRARNRQKLKGVNFHKQHKRFQSQIQVDKRKIHIGYFKTAEEAHAAYCAAAKKLHGEFARFA